ncbi:phenylalanine 4-monooxygenase [Paraglaciecola polaris]|uniref:Phenylalanine-4-hydroxylase n=1 Tax=Paraglaciecola polaris LMG 21857 TaxID=1129793 RepID=K7ADH0_9ALTE|nr:phenylalanine 4-monooxygenase [Paraglaciecola polaris]GAC33345.1 phenylalanine-4-hydroxylase [Paraglaciecola polaris LMG 21857]|tara:strand:- start:4259 stop:5059 length:801 start_codon:yes stop_codon:yes gene_type:complete
MAKQSQYTSHTPDENGIVHWSETENKIWQRLITQQKSLLHGRACDEYLQGLALLDLPDDRIPQLGEVNDVLADTTGWEVVQVPALINFDSFFKLLANKQFPVATFIRSDKEFDYLQEPDVFHEIFGHCPLLTNPAFAHFTHTYGKLGYAASPKERQYLARLYWFTVEFGLVDTQEGLRIYGGGILSSPKETRYALENAKAVRRKMQPLKAVRTPYRIDIIQPIYYVLDSLASLFDLANSDIMQLVEEGQKRGLYPPQFEQKLSQEN